MIYCHRLMTLNIVWCPVCSHCSHYVNFCSHMTRNPASGTEGSVVSSGSSGVVMLVTVESVSKTSQILNWKHAWFDMLCQMRVACVCVFVCCIWFQFKCFVWMWLICFEYMWLPFDCRMCLFFSVGGCKNRRIIQTSLGLSCAKN